MDNHESYRIGVLKKWEELRCLIKNDIKYMKGVIENNKPINIETHCGDFEKAPLSIHENWNVQNGYIIESDLIEMRVALKRELTIKELQIMRILQEEGVLMTLDDFKPFPG